MCTLCVTFKNAHAVGTALLFGVSLICECCIRDTLIKAKALDESHQFIATTEAKIGDFSRKIDLADMVFLGVEAARTANQKYGISNHTISCFCSGQDSISCSKCSRS